MEVDRIAIEPGTLLVLTDVDLPRAGDMERLASAIAEAAGHTRFVILRVGSDNPVTKFSVDEVLAALAEPKENDDQPDHQRDGDRHG